MTNVFKSYLIGMISIGVISCNSSLVSENKNLKEENARLKRQIDSIGEYNFPIKRLRTLSAYSISSKTEYIVGDTVSHFVGLSFNGVDCIQYFILGDFNGEFGDTNTFVAKDTIFFNETDDNRGINVIEPNLAKGEHVFSGLLCFKHPWFGELYKLGVSHPYEIK